MHKTCKDSCDEDAQLVLKAAPQHQTSNDAYFFVLKASLDSASILIQNLIFLKLIELRREKNTFMCFGEF